MLAGPARRGFLPWTDLWARDRRAAFRQAVSGGRAAGAVGVPDRDRGAPEDNDRPDDDRGEDGLHRGWAARSRKRKDQRKYKTLIAPIGLFLILGFLAGDRALSAREGYDRASHLFQRGELANCEAFAADLADRK